eukprot:COSAG05_NODE_283_length_12245_cov_19.640458_3_plen_41_part_00
MQSEECWFDMIEFTEHVLPGCECTLYRMFDVPLPFSMLSA